MFQKAKTTNKLTALLLVLVMLLSLVPGMGLTAYATPTETLLTTITATGKEQASYSTENVATVSFSYTAGGSSSYMNNGTTATWGWWGYGWTATVAPANGYTITKCVFYDDKDRTATDSEAPFVVETTEEDKTPQVNGTPILAYTSKGITKIEVYGYAMPAHTHNFTYAASGATITATCNGAGDCDITTGLTLTISAPTGDLVADGTKTFPATLSTGYNPTAFPEGSISEISYTKDGEPFTGTPTEAGAYTASVTVGDATASVSYTIANPDQLAADAVIALIDAIGTVEYTDACKDKIDAARAAYDALTADQQALVNNYSTLTEAKTEYDELKGDADIALANLLRIRNATASVNGTTITLTPEDETATASMVCKLWDRTDVEFSNLDGATISKGGSLYADKYATATATIGGVEYTVVFNYEVIEFVLTPDLLKITNAEAAVDGTTITLTPVDESKQVNLYPKLKDGSEVVFSGISGLATTSKAGTLYAKGVASAKATINGTEYTVVFNYTPPTVDELIKTAGATVSVEGTTITLTATSGKVCFYSSLKDGSKATYSKSTITEGLNVTSTVSKSGTLYAIGDASAVVTIGGVEYTVNFVF